MRFKPSAAAISASAVMLFCGCERSREQPWRKALDEGKVVRLGGSVGKLTPGADATNAPLFPAPVVVQPSTSGPSTAKKAPVDDLPLPAPPKAVEKKPAAAEKGDEPKLGPPR
jgi:hypothetical protein